MNTRFGTKLYGEFGLSGALAEMYVPKPLMELDINYINGICDNNLILGKNPSITYESGISLELALQPYFIHSARKYQTPMKEEFRRRILLEYGGVATGDAAAAKVAEHWRKRNQCLVRHSRTSGYEPSWLRHAHACLMGSPATGSNWRSGPAWAGGSGAAPLGARYVAPPYAAVPGLIDDLCRWLIRATEVKPETRLALAVYQFLCVHPFTDGNGRISRLIPHLMVGVRRKPTLAYLTIEAEMQMAHQSGWLEALITMQNSDLAAYSEWWTGAYRRSYHAMSLSYDSVSELNARIEACSGYARSWSRCLREFWRAPVVTYDTLRSRLRGSEKVVRRQVDALIDADILQLGFKGAGSAESKILIFNALIEQAERLRSQLQSIFPFLDDVEFATTT